MFTSKKYMRLRALELAVDVKKQYPQTKICVSELAAGYFAFISTGACTLYEDGEHYPLRAVVNK